MVNSKDKGSGFERDVVNKLNSRLDGGGFKRIVGSGAIGTAYNEPLLTGDIKGNVKGLPKGVRIECKVGYGGETQLTLKREWLNKIKREAEESNSLPLLIGKFSGARKADGVQEFVVLDINDFIYVMNLISNMSNDIDKLYNKVEKING